MENHLKSRRFAPRKYIFTLFFVGLGLLFSEDLALSQSVKIFAVLFYSPTCGHCQVVIQEYLPPLIEKYGDQLNILAINVASPEGQELYQNAVQRYEIPQERLGVPCLIVGETVLVGSREIPEFFPQIIDEGISTGGIGWPDIPGLVEIIPSPQEEVENEISNNTSDDITNQVSDAPLEDNLTATDRFSQDLVGNTLSVIVLFGMFGSVIGASYSLIKAPALKLTAWPTWTIPILAIIGILVAGYLSYVEVTQTEAVCGPVGDCNTVQQSPYAVLFGVLPVGILGIIGYMLILIGWSATHYGPTAWRFYSALATWIMAFLGVLFSIYLTFLEPFVIGATCAWCLSSAIIITIILWAASADVRVARNPNYST